MQYSEAYSGNSWMMCKYEKEVVGLNQYKCIIRFVVLWIVIPGSKVVTYQSFGGLFHLHHLKTEETLVPYHITTWCYNPEDHDLNLHRREL